MSWKSYKGDRYLDYHSVSQWCDDLASAHPEWVKTEVIGESRNGLPVWLVTIGKMDAGVDERPAFWIDGGLHATEWTGVMSVLYSVSKWVGRLDQKDDESIEWFSKNTIYALPCISPDGFQTTIEGGPFLRSSLRPPKEGDPLTGFEEKDLDGDGVVRWMRWKSSTGNFVQDEKCPYLMRPRRIDDKASDAYHCSGEGVFLNWDGTTWSSAPMRYGADLNRNFPAQWGLFSMFGMDGGDYAISEPESRCVVDTFASHPNIAAAVSNHTYTGCVLTQPSHPNSPLPGGDIRIMEGLAREAVEGTGYRVFRFFPDFVYDTTNLVTGSWDNTMCTLFGVAGYSVEMWDPDGYFGVSNNDPAKDIFNPKIDDIRTMIEGFSSMPNAVSPWKCFDHPQLGNVEIGGIDYYRTIRNPPESLLAAECEKGFVIADRIRKCLPNIQVKTQVTMIDGDIYSIEVMLENSGYLSTSGLAHGAKLRSVPAVSVSVEKIDGDVDIICGQTTQVLPHVTGWGSCASPLERHPIYASLSTQGPRTKASWVVKGSGLMRLRWFAGKAGRGLVEVEVPVTCE